MNTLELVLYTVIGSVLLGASIVYFGSSRDEDVSDGYDAVGFKGDVLFGIFALGGVSAVLRAAMDSRGLAAVPALLFVGFCVRLARSRRQSRAMVRASRGERG
jgi:hypothetical protein